VQGGSRHGNEESCRHGGGNAACHAGSFLIHN
jgi:hypothetical protein